MRVSIGISFFNAASTLADAIRAVFAQTLSDWELILVDDGSTDGSSEIAQAIDDPRVTVIRGRQKRGLPYRLNQIAEAAQGAYIARMDADDLMHPERLHRQIRHLDAHPNVDLVATGMYAIDSYGDPTSKRGCEMITYTAKRLLAAKGPAHATVVGRSEWFRKNPYDSRCLRSQDYELWCRTYAAGRLHAECLPEPLYFVREEQAVTLRKVLNDYRTIRRAVIAYGPGLVGYPLTIVEIAKLWAKEVLHGLLVVSGRQASLVQRRNIPLPAEEAATAKAVMEAILQTSVPGFPAGMSYPAAKEVGPGHPRRVPLQRTAA